MIPLNYHHLYYFFVIAKEGAISKACEKLRLAQPTLSAQLKQFEAFLGKQLFERRKQRLYLTDEGRIVLDYAESIFELGQELQETLRNPQASAGPRSIKVGVLNETPKGFTEALVSAVLAHDPTAHVTLHEGPLEFLIGELRQQRLDVLLTNVSIPSAEAGELTNRAVATVPVVFAAAPQIARRYPKPPQDLDGAPFILPAPPSPVYQVVHDFFAAHRISPRILVEVQDAEVARRLAIAGVGIAALSAYAIATSAPANALIPLKRRALPDLFENIYLVSRHRKWPNPLAKHLLETFRITEEAWRGLRLSKAPVAKLVVRNRHSPPPPQRV